MSDEEMERENAREESLQAVEDEQWEQAKGSVTAELQKQLERVLEGAREDMAEISGELSIRAVEAARAGDELSLKAIACSVRLKAEKSRLRAKHGLWDVVENTALVVLETAFGVLTSALVRRV